MLYFCRFVVFFILLCVTSVDAYSQLPQRKSITVATWNIGHFSNGVKDYSYIKPSNFDEKVKKFRTFIYDSIKADILCVNEYESEFCLDSVRGNAIAEDIVFNGFTTQRVFKKNRYVCNAIFSDKALSNVRKKKFNYDKTTKETIKYISWFYFVSADIMIDGKSVKLVCTHLVNRHEDECQRQMQQLIEEFGKYDKVIICGDMNSSDWTKFKQAGYTLANDGSQITFPYRSSSLDNIMVKGLKISEARIVKTKLSDHYSVVCEISLE